MGDGEQKLVPDTNPEDTKDLLKWVGGGFTLVVAILAFFGIKDGVLASVVRTEPEAAMAVFALVGVGVVLALIVPAMQSDQRAPYLLLLGVLALITAAATHFAPDLPQSEVQQYLGWFPWLVAGVFVVVGVVLDRKKLKGLKWPNAALIVAVFSLACGLWVVTKISVIQTMRLDTGAVVANLKSADGLTSVEVAASGTALAGPVRVRVVGTATGSTEPRTISEIVLMPNQGGGLSATTSVPLGPTPWTEIRVRSCQEYNRNLDRVEPCTNFVDQSVFAFEARHHSLTGTLKPNGDGKRVAATVEASGLPAGAYVDLQVTRAQTVVATARLRVGVAGTASWTGEAGVAAKPSKWQLAATVCEPAASGDGQCSGAEVLASLDLRS